ncbi:hypothetical protein OO25_04785 [Phaeobacter sp. S60]|nr:hypothetical protein OO25_04785 [Phaeobacter sp. S60]
MQNHTRFAGVQIGNPKVLVQIDNGRVTELIRASNAGTMQQSQGLGLLLRLEGEVNDLILKKGNPFPMHVMSHRLHAVFRHRHHMRKCTRNNELQGNKNDEDTADHRASFCSNPISAAGSTTVKREKHLL